MKITLNSTVKLVAALTLIFLACSKILATTYYVSLGGGNVSPYTNWATAANTIQDAVDVASAGETVVVTNGIYDTGETVTPGYFSSNRVVITADITVKSVNGPENTIILGKGPFGDGAVRGVYMSAGILEGFTITDGHSQDGDIDYDLSGGGVNMFGGNGIITNCIIRGNEADYSGGGTIAGTVNNCKISGNFAYGNGGGTFLGTVNNCTISGNTADFGGGASDSIVINSTISGNSANQDGGGSYQGTVINSTISGNSAIQGGGAYQGNVDNCTISGNTADNTGGGSQLSIVNNCIISGNSAYQGGGGTYYGTVYNSTISGNSAIINGGGSYQGTVINSTISGNSAYRGGGTYYGTVNNSTISGNSAYRGGGTYYGTVNNCIVWDNTASIASNNFFAGTISYSCSSPLPTGAGNISSDPMLVNSSHIATNSPCIGAGSISYASGVDIDGEAWKNPPSIGCDEVYANALTGSLSVAVSANKTKTYIESPLTFSVDIEGRAALNIWTFGDGTAETNKIEVTHSWSAIGEYNVVVTAFNETYPGGISDSVSIKVITNIHFVNINNLSPVPPYSSWNTAATNIQDAVDVAWNGGIILVSNGIYSVGETVMPGYSCFNRVVITRNITVKSVNGPENTIILGKGPVGSGAVRGVSMYAGILSGFTISNGHTWVYSSGGEDYDSSGGGVNMYGGNGMVTNCVIIGNRAGLGGGGTYQSTVINCTISKNSAFFGGGTYEGIIHNCTISGNNADIHGGGTWGGTVNNCTIIGNNASNRGGGSRDCTVNNCTIIGNSAGKDGGGTSESTVNNCIIWANSAGSDDNFVGGTIRYSCSSPLPAGAGNISTNPQFVSGSDFHLQEISPCINVGTNALAAMPVDLDGNPRIIGNRVDMGAYEYPFAFLNITNVYGIIPYFVSSVSIAGTNNKFVAGTILWSNETTHTYGEVTRLGPESNSWASTVALAEGYNIITVSGTNIDGIWTSDSVSIHRETWEEFHPYIKITNAPAVVSYYQQTADISGTNMNISGGLYWVNSRHPIATNLLSQGFSTTINNLEHGDNWITVFGENKYGYPTNDVVNIHRKTWNESAPQIATNALIFPSAGAELFEGDLTNIIWNSEKITDDIDGTNLTISKISVHLAETTNEVSIVTNDVSNLLGEIPWLVPESLIGGDTNYVLRFEVVDSSSLTNSRIFWDNTFAVVPEPVAFGAVISYLLLVISIWRRKF